MAFKPEMIALVMNAFIFFVYLFQWAEPGKILYWGGVVILTAGLFLMKG